MPRIGQYLFKKGNLSEKEHPLNEILHFCQKKGTKNKDFGKNFCQKKAPKQKVQKTVKKKAPCQKKGIKKGTPGVYVLP